MDGNGRWAQQRGLKRTEGHAAGEDALFDTVEGAVELGIDWFTVYAFSTENWRRPADEVRYLMGFNKGILERHAEDLHSRNVRIRFVGRRDWRVPRGVLRRMEWADRADRAQHRHDAHRSRSTTAAGPRSSTRSGRSWPRASTPEKIDEKDDRAGTSTCPTMPDPDLMIRTSGEYRISNFLLWELAYSEIVFTDVLWPDFRREHLVDAIREYQARDRRFGGLADED